MPGSSGACLNVRFLIDRLVEQSTVLIAQLATSGGVRAPLAELSNQMFVNLARELDAQGISRKVSADMFGMALRAYLKKIQRLSESSTDEGQSLWEAVLGFVHKRGGATRGDILERFHRDEEQLVRAVLHDLVENGLITLEGSGLTATYRAEALETSRLVSPENFAELLWLVIFREGPLQHDELARRSVRRAETFETALELLLETGRVTRTGEGATAIYESHHFVVPPGTRAGWEAAVLDHFRGLVTTVCQVLRGNTSHAERENVVGGFTYTFDVWPEHPLADEVYGTLGELRSRLTQLRSRVDAHNAEHGRPERFEEVVVYGGQCVGARPALDARPPAPAASGVADSDSDS